MSHKNGYRHQTDRQTDRQADGNEILIFSYSRGHETSRKHKSGYSSDGFDYNTFFGYAREVKSKVSDMNRRALKRIIR